MAITPEQVKNKEFAVRLRGYDPGEVRAFLKQAADAYRATIRDGGAEWALANVSDDLAGLMRAAHSSAQKVLDAAEADAAEVRARADSYSAGRHEAADHEAGLAVEVLMRTQSQADQVTTDCGSAREILEQAETRAAETLAEAEEQAATITRLAERDARDRVDTIREQATGIEVEAEAEARRRVESILSEGQRRLEVLEETEGRLHERIAAAQTEFRGIVERLLGPDHTIDLTGVESILAFDSARAMPMNDDTDDDTAAAMVSSAVNRAMQGAQG